MRHSLAGLVAVTILIASAAARAQDPPAPVEQPLAPPPMAGAAPELTPITLPAGRLQLRVPVAINLSKNFAAKPISIPLDVYYGVNDDLSVGLTHSAGVVQSTSFYGPGRGICVTGKTNGCNKVYNNIGLDAILRFLGPTLQLGAHGGLDFQSIDPALISLRLGVLFQAPLGENIALIADPRIFLGLNKRDSGNKESLSLPVAVQLWMAPRARVAVRTIFGGPLSNFSDFYAGSLGIFAAGPISDVLDLFLSFDFANLYGKHFGGVGAADSRVLVAGINVDL